MRSAGRMLLTSPVVFPAFEQVSIVLSSSADANKLIILDCGTHDRTVPQRKAHAKDIRKQWPRAVRDGRTATAATTSRGRPPRAAAPPSRAPGVGGRSPELDALGSDAEAAGGSSSGAGGPPARSGDALGGAAGGGETDAGSSGLGLVNGARGNQGEDAEAAGQRGAARGAPAGSSDRAEGAGDSVERDGAESDAGREDGASECGEDDESAPSITAARDLARTLSSSSLKQSLSNTGAPVSDPLRPARSVTMAMLKHFLRVTRLSSLEDLKFSQCIRLWGMAKDVKNEMVAASGVARDWRTLCPSALWDGNWAMELGSSAVKATGDRKSLFPPRHPRVKCSTESRKVGLVVAFALSPFWNLVVRQYFDASPRDADEDSPGSDRDSAPGDAVEGGDGRLATPRVPADDDPVLRPRTSTPSDTGRAAVDEAAAGAPPAADALLGAPPAAGVPPRTPPDADAPPEAAPAADTPQAGVRRDGTSKKSAADVLNAARLKRTAIGSDNGAGRPPLKKPRGGKAAADPPSPPAAPGSVKLGTLVDRSALNAQVTGAPIKRLVNESDPPTPARAMRVMAPSDKLVLRSAAAAARSITTSQLVSKWRTVPSVSPDDGVAVRVVPAKEFATVLNEQDAASFLLPRASLKQAGQALHALWGSGRDVDARSSEERVVIEASVSGVVHRLPFAAVALMTEVHQCNEDYTLAGQSSLWLETIGKKQMAVDPVSNPFLLPTRLSVSQMKATVRSAIGGARLKDNIWQRTVASVRDPRTGEAVDLLSSWRLDVRSFLDTARSVWVKCSFADPMLVELAHFCGATGRDTYVLTCEKFTSMLRTSQGTTAELADAMRLGSRWAVGAGRCTSFATMVNHGNSHWCAAFVSIPAREIVFYDPYAPSAVDRCTETSLARLRLLGVCIISAQLGRSGVVADVAWSTRHARFPRQLSTDSTNCGVFALQFLVTCVTGSAFELDGEEADLLRLVLLHKLVVAGRVEREEGTTIS